MRNGNATDIRDADPLLYFTAGLGGVKTPAAVVNGLEAAVQQVKQLRGVYHVMGAWYLSRVITDPAQIEGQTLWWADNAPPKFCAEYFEILERTGPTATQHLARGRLLPFTFTEARRTTQPTGRDGWVFDLMHKHGMRDGYYCPLHRWALVYWSQQPVEPGPFESGCLAGAAYLAMLRIEALVPRPERFERQGKSLTAREVEVLRLASTGLTRKEIADALEISERTADHHVDSAIKSLAAKNITEACVQAIRYKFFT